MSLDESAEIFANVSAKLPISEQFTIPFSLVEISTSYLTFDLPKIISVNRGIMSKIRKTIFSWFVNSLNLPNSAPLRVVVFL